jgi:hypothetical protein
MKQSLDGKSIEYWILEVPGKGLVVHDSPLSGWGNQPIHVIKYSAYRSAIEERDQAIRAMNAAHESLRKSGESK